MPLNHIDAVKPGRLLKRKIFRSKYPLARQYDQIDCGPAALLSVLKFWGGDSSIVHIRELANTDAGGTNMLGLVEAAEKLGFQAYGATGDYEELMKEQMPCIAHVVLDNQLQHFVVIYRIDEKGVLVGDPGKGLYKLSQKEFLDIWKQKAVVLVVPQEKPFLQSPPHWLRWILAYFRKEEPWLYQTIFLGIVVTGLGLLIAIFVQWLIDRFIPQRALSKIIITAAFLLGLQMLKAAAGYLRQRFLIELNKRVSINVNAEFLSHLFHLPLNFFLTRKKGDITARINDSVKIQQALLHVAGITVIDGLIILGSFIFLFILASPLGWTAAVTLPFYALLLFLVTRKIRQAQSDVMKSYAQVESFYFDSLSGIDDILSYNSSSAYAKLNRFIFENFQNQIARLGLTQARVNFLAELAAGTLIVGALSFGAILVIKNMILLGQMVAAYALLANMLPAINRLVEAHIALQGASIAVQRLFDLLLVEKEKNLGAHPFRLIEAIHIDHAQFSWPKGMPLFKDLTLSIPKGQITSLWGASGAGKSTLAKILQRKYALHAGAILVDSTPIDQFDLHDLRRNIAIVPQAIKIFNGTILENILVGRETRDMRGVQEYIAVIGLADFFSRFEHGLLTGIGETGRQLSSGEMQVIGLTRALLHKPEMVIVDEGMNAIDAEIEYLMFAILRAYARQHAVFLISHNLWMLARTDKIYLLENGMITGGGKPEKLLQSNSRFQALCQNQRLQPTTHYHEAAYVS
jgi:ATP-binding cassette subfamily B protein